MLRNTLLAAVLAVSTLFSTAFAADLPSSPTNEQLATRVVVLADQKKWTIDIDQVQRIIEGGVNFGTNEIVIPIKCDATDCLDAIAVNVQNGSIIRLPTAVNGYEYRAGNPLLIVNPDPKAYLKSSDLMGTGKLPDWYFRELYTIENGKFVLFHKDKGMDDDIPNESLFQTFVHSGD